MSTRGAYELADGTFVRTQGEIPKGEPVNKVGIPVGHQELIDFINGIIERERSHASVTPEQMLVGNPDEDEPAEEAPPPPPPPAAPKTDETEMRRRLAQSLRGMETEAVEEKILEAKGPAFARLFVAGVERFGALGKDAWDGVRGFLDLHQQQIGAYDRGLHLLALSQIERMNEAPAEPKSYKELNG